MTSTDGVRQTPQRGRLAALDGLRLLAALAVAGFHFVGIDLDYWGVPSRMEFPTLNEVARYGYLGVELFFMISGFVILMSAYGRNLTSFVSSRVSRLFPAYWVAIILTFLLQRFWENGRQVPIFDALVNMTMIQGAFDIPNVQGAFWTLWIELKFYLVIGLFIMVGITRRRVIAFAILWPLVAQLARATGAPILSSLLNPTYASYFAGGMLLYLLYRHGHDLMTWLGIGLNWALCVSQAARYAATTASEQTQNQLSPELAAVAVTAMFAVIYACSHGRLADVRWGWLTTAGALTYPLYLVHGQFGFFLIDALQEDLNSYVVLAAAVVTSVLLAWCIHRFVERPWQRPLRSAIDRSLADLADVAPASAGQSPRPRRTRTLEESIR